MTAPPKAISQGSNGAGGGAFTAKSAAKAGPATASIAAANINFFMTIPITFPRASPGLGSRKANDTSQKRKSRVMWSAADGAGKQKTQAFAAFLGVTPAQPKVVGVCCIRTTF